MIEVNDLLRDLEAATSLSGLLGYLNYSEGKPDPRFQKQLNDTYALVASRQGSRPWEVLPQLFHLKLTQLQKSGTAAFRDVSQAKAVLHLTFDQVLPAYRTYHADLLFHLSDEHVFQPFLVARVLEAVLAQGGPWEEEKRIVSGALRQLNDFVGYRPIAILETRPRGEPYDHERMRPIPLFIRGTGVAYGPYQELLRQTLDILATTPAEILHEADFDLELLDELAVDPRAYDHHHPANRRPNYSFGEWDPHHLDHQGRYRRYVVRQIILDALLERVGRAEPSEHEESLFNAAAVLAGTILMASGISGGSPSSHDSSVTLAKLLPQIAGYRDAFYVDLLAHVPSEHGERLRKEAEQTRQPFGGVRQHLNQYLARRRAAQLQKRHLAILFARMGYAKASREFAAQIQTPSARFVSEILSRLMTGRLLAERGELTAAAKLLPEVEDLLQRGIQIGALVDPWNILGFQARFPLFQALEDAVHDPRVDELVGLVEGVLERYAALLNDAAATGDKGLEKTLKQGFRRFAYWWDQVASVEVSGIARVHGGETLAAAEHVATALRNWRQRGAAPAELAFWRQHLDGFTSPRAFVQVINALLQRSDHVAAMGLLMQWLSQAEQIPLQASEYSFHAVVLRWMKSSLHSKAPWSLVEKFFRHLEANAEEYWGVPEFSTADDEPESAKKENAFEAAYEGMTYRDSAEDGETGNLIEGRPLASEFALEFESERLGKRLAFLETVARLWIIAGRWTQGFDPDQSRTEVLISWWETARGWYRELLILMGAIHACPIPQPLGSHDSLVEYDRRRVLKEQLLGGIISTCLEMYRAFCVLSATASLGRDDDSLAPGEAATWEPLLWDLQTDLARGHTEEAKRLLYPFLEVFANEPLLYEPLDAGGDPKQILRVRLAQITLSDLLTELPRHGLLQETYHLLKTARAMESRTGPGQRPVSEFDRLFHAGYGAVLDTVLESAATWQSGSDRDGELARLLEALARPFLLLSVEHSRTLRLSSLEAIRGEEEWQALGSFIRRYGADLFTAKFMTLANLRGILQSGVDALLDRLSEEADPLHPIRLVEELDRAVPRAQAVSHLKTVLQVVVENYDEYKDYNTTTTQSDYGDKLGVLLDFLRLKAGYDRQAWQFRPLTMVHEALARKHRPEAARLWERELARFTHELAEYHLAELAKLEQQHGIRLATVRDRLEERFARPLAVDRLSSLIEPAMEAARHDEQNEALANLLRELQPFADTPSGVGLELPAWLRRLESEAARVKAAQTEVELAPSEVRVRLTKEAIEAQLRTWEGG